ncbi:MAG: response regulator [Candidatus Latescibacteria bacterium]|nr:response regulator [Candidatus Latescibacterota bacterium]
MKILLVDDDPCSVSALANLLQFDHTLWIARNGVEALEQCRKELFDVVVTDIRMPKMNGVELIEALSREENHAPVILMSGFSDLIDPATVGNNNVIACFLKPINVGKFMETLDAIGQ